VTIDGSPITRLLATAAAGDSRAAADLLPMVYDELRVLARHHLARAAPGNTLQPTALVHEAYMRLVGSGDPQEAGGWEGRRHFFGAAANAMRNILVDQARRKAAAKHGGGRIRVEGGEGDIADLPIAPPAEDLLALEEALSELERADPRQGEIVSLRFFAGLTAEQTAKAMGISLSTVEREWRFARSFLHARVKGLDADQAPGGAP
jgi:RNA polymerase sigma factor (TIGR02999 family)